MTQTAVATLDGSDYVEVSFTETPQGAFAAVIAVLGELKRGIWLRGCRVPFVAGAALDAADCRGLSSANIRRMCNIDAYRMGKGFAQLTTAMQSLSNNVKVLPPPTANGSSSRNPGASVAVSSRGQTVVVPRLPAGAVAGIVVAAAALRKDAHDMKRKKTEADGVSRSRRWRGGEAGSARGHGRCWGTPTGTTAHVRSCRLCLHLRGLALPTPVLYRRAGE